MLPHPETSYRLAEQRLGEYRRQAAAGQQACSAGRRWPGVIGLFFARLASLFARPRAASSGPRPRSQIHDPVDL